MGTYLILWTSAHGNHMCTEIFVSQYDNIIPEFFNIINSSHVRSIELITRISGEKNEML
jgi:hypothetical protein